MKMAFIVEVEITHVNGKFASKDDLAEKIREEIDGCNPGTVNSDKDAEYEISDWTVDFTG